MRFSSKFRRSRFGLGAVTATVAAWLVLVPVPGAANSGTALPAGPDSTEALRLPEILSSADAGLYRNIFTLQERGKWRAADKRIARLVDKRLMGHVLAQRYLHPTAYRSKYKELRDWMAKYADHPDAKRIYKLALKRRPKNYKRPRPPALRKGGGAPPRIVKAEPYRSTMRLNRDGRRKAARLKRQVRRNVLRTRLSVTEKLLTSKQAKRLLDTVERDEAYAEVAAGWYYYGRNDKAYDLAHTVADRSGAQVPIAHWIAGLAAWRLGRIEDATDHFERLARSDRVSDWNAASGAYWAARGNLRLRRPAQMSAWLALAARYPHTFYGLLARRALGVRARFEFRSNPLTPDQIARLAAEPTSARALALLQVGQNRRAERELRGVNYWADAELTSALLALAERARMAGLAYRLGNRLAAVEHPMSSGGVLDMALYPIPSWRPERGFIVDRALVYALIRQESGFNPQAKSPDGARGLMQLMPSTASFMARDRRFRRSKRRKLFDPAINLELGQRYIAHLLDHEYVQGNLFRLAAAYNGGPGNLNKWQRNMEYGDDPLLFIESLPSHETRLFVERVLTNLWIYRMRLGQPTPSLDGIAAGLWPLYESLDIEPPELASNEQYR